MTPPNRLDEQLEAIIGHSLSDGTDIEGVLPQGTSTQGQVSVLFNATGLNRVEDIPYVNFRAIITDMKSHIERLENQIEELTIQGLIKPIAIYDLNENHILNQPIHLVLQESEDHSLVTWPELDLFGEGNCPSDAISTLKTEIVALYDDLVSTPASELGSLPKQWLRTLNRIILVNA